MPVAWTGLPDILNPTAISTDKRPSMDFSSSAQSQPNHGVYGTDLDQTFNSLHNGVEGANGASAQHHPGSLVSGHGFDHPEGLDVSDQTGFNMFTNSGPGSAFSSHRYRTNASSSSSLGPTYGIGADSM